MPRSLRFAFLVALFAALVSPAASALAAPAAWQSVDVTLYSETSASTLMVSGELPASVPLPATAELSVPAGSEVQWIGEVLGGPSSADTALKYAKLMSGGSDIYRFELTKSRVAQIEVLAATPVPFDGKTYSPSVRWSATQAVPKVNLRVRVPQGAQIVQQIADAKMEPGESGFSGYTKTFTTVKAGDKLDLAFAYTAPIALAPTTPTASSSSSLVVPAIVAVIAILAGLLLVRSVRQKLARKSSNSTGSSGKAASAKTRAATNASAGKTGRKGKASGSNVERAAETSGLSALAKRNTITAVLIGVMVIAGLVLGSQATKPQLAGDTISKTFSQGAPCASATIQVVQKDGADPAATADVLFKALEALDGMNTGTFNAKTSSIDVGWCESKTTEDAVRGALEPTGLIADSGAPPVGAPSGGALE